MKYKSEDIEVEALEYKGNPDEVRFFCGDKADISYPDQTSYPTPFIYLDTPDGEENVNHGDFIIKYPNGDFTCVRPAVFNMVYKPINQ